MVLGRLVVDAERITGRADIGEIYLIAIYEVQDDLIHRVWPLRG
ncbi:MAG: steroid delta-isomerase, partial [Chloroflexi bacterium]|nr:steroid delta-isomerase [Chloroflexota bacterium]